MPEGVPAGPVLVVWAGLGVVVLVLGTVPIAAVGVWAVVSGELAEELLVAEPEDPQALRASAQARQSAIPTPVGRVTRS